MKIVNVSDMRVSIESLFFCLCISLWSLHGYASSRVLEDKTELRLAVASNFYHAASVLAKDFERAENIRVEISTASSGVLANQIAQGAQFDIFFSADEEKVTTLTSLLSLDQGNVSVYALGQLILVYRKQEQDACTLNDLFEIDENARIPIRMLLANPVLAPYGKAAEYFLTKVNFEQKGKKFQYVYGNNVAQVSQMFSQGAAEYAWLAASQKHFFDKDNRYCVVVLPVDAYPPIKQAMLVLKPEKESTKIFKEFLASSGAREIIKNHGYILP